MNPMINGFGCRIPHEESCCCLQNRDVFTEPFILSIEPFNLRMLSRCDTVTDNSVYLRLVHPFSKRFTPNTALLRDRTDRGPFLEVFRL